MFGVLANVKVLAAAAVATVGIAAGGQSANAAHFRGGFGVNLVLPLPVAAPVYQAPLVVAAPVYTPAPVVVQAPVYVPAPTVVYGQGYYAPRYVVVNDYHRHWAPVMNFRGGWRR